MSGNANKTSGGNVFAGGMSTMVNNIRTPTGGFFNGIDPDLAPTRFVCMSRTPQRSRLTCPLFLPHSHISVRAQGLKKPKTSYHANANITAPIR